MSSAFISYSWDSDTHKLWVKGLADALIGLGIETILDQYDLQPGDDKHLFMEKATDQASHIIIVCSTTYKSKADDRKGGVGEETSLITSEFYQRIGKGKRYIPVKYTEESFEKVLPRYLGSILGIDFHDKDIAEKHNELASIINGESLLQKPKLGSRKNILNPHTVSEPETVEPALGSNRRSMNKALKKQLTDSLPKTAKVRITSVLGNSEALTFAQEIYDFLNGNGYQVKGVDQAVYSKPVVGQIINKTETGFDIVIGSKE